MPLPFLLGAAALAAGVLGLGAQASAKETNERAQQVIDEANNIYDDAKNTLANAQTTTEASLLSLGKSKKVVLETSINQFLIAYERIKNIELSESVGLDEIKNFALEKQDALQLREMSDIYQSTFSSGVAGAATGAVIALAASGSLPVVTGVLSTAGTALMAGQVGVAAGFAGSALSLGAAMTPLAAIAAPALLFTGISASIKADENLEKAQTMYAETETACEKMKTSEVLCLAISNRADMFDDLLLELNVMFSQCTSLLDGITRKKRGFFKNKTIDANQFTEDELKLVAVTRALAGAVKAVIDAPILTSEGIISSQSESIHKDTIKKLPAFVEAVNDVKCIDYKVKPIEAKNVNRKNNTTNPLLDCTRNIIAIIIGGFISLFSLGITFDYGFSLIAFSVPVLIIMNNQTKFKLFRFAKKITCIILASGFTLVFYGRCLEILQIKFSIVYNIVAGIISFVLFALCIPDKDKNCNTLRRTFVRLFGCIFFFSLGILVFALLYKLFGFSYTTSVIISSIAYAFFALVSAFSAD